ncbi:MAG TPA: VWA domain-containing protein [bacterium]|nr:VWA domain-containing protein [bacterium]
MPIPNPTTPTMPTAATTAASRLVSADGKVLPLRNAALTARAGGGLARTRLRQTFRNPHDAPLAVTYLLPLPADGAIAAFAFTIGDRRITGEVDRRAAARERFEQALVSGHTAALLEEDRSSLFRQEIGNVPPGADVVVELEIDQPLAWRSDGNEWEYRFPTVVAPRYQGEPGRVADATRQAVDIADGPLPQRLELRLDIADRIADGTTPTSPSHPLQHSAPPDGPLQVTFADRSVRLDRDVVVRWATGEPDVGVRLDCARPATHAGADDAFGLLTLVPPRGARPSVSRDLVLLIDTSGSMSGAPLEQAVAVAQALVRSLEPNDRLRMVEFSSAPHEWFAAPVHATPENVELALMWLDMLRAHGGTEMLSGVRQALQPLRTEAQTQVVLLTDGLVGFEDEITAHLVRELPRQSRCHVLGVGAAANRSLTRAVARAGRGTEAIVGTDEPAVQAAAHLVRAMQNPVVVDLEIRGTAVREVAPQALPDLFAAAPARVALRLDPDGGVLRVRGRTADGTFERELQVEPTERGHGRRELAALFARERVEDIETERAARTLPAGNADAAIERLGLTHQIATRLTSWIAVTDTPTVDGSRPTRREIMPHELPHGMAVEGLGLRSSSGLDQVCMSICDDEDTFLDEPMPKASPAAPHRTESDARRSCGADLASGVGRLMGSLFGGRTAKWRVQLIRCADGQLVLAFHNEGTAKVPWSLPRHLELCLSDGTVVSAATDARTSTTDRRVPAGGIAEVVLTLPEESSGEDLPEHVRLPGGDWLPIRP